jgi:hypothetical protein
MLAVRRHEGQPVADSTMISDPEHNWSTRVPDVTPSGQAVEILKGQREGMHRVHAHSPDECELYIEIVSYPTTIDHDVAVAEQKAFLSTRSSDSGIGETKRSEFHGFGATEFHFEGTLQGRWKVRRFVFVDSPIRTYRVIHDPRSDLNERTLESLVIEVGRVA